MSLRLCRSCSRHVRASEESCPFCRSALAPEPPRDRLIEVPLRLGRSALAAIAAGTLYACSSQQPAPPPAAVVPVSPPQQLVPSPPVELAPTPPLVELTPSPPAPAPPIPTAPPRSSARPRPIVRPVEPPPDFDPIPVPAYGVAPVPVAQSGRS